MKRQRLTVAALGLVLAAGFAAWWLASKPLSAEERKLVGVWRFDPEVADCLLEFRTDRSRIWTIRSSLDPAGRPFVDGARWSLQDGKLLIDHEPNPVRRALRPVSGRLGIDVKPADPVHLRWRTADEITLTGRGTAEMVYTRVPTD